MDNSNTREFYLFGKYRTTGTISPDVCPKQMAMLFKIDKNTGNMKYKLTFGN